MSIYRKNCIRWSIRTLSSSSSSSWHTRCTIRRCMQHRFSVIRRWRLESSKCVRSMGLLWQLEPFANRTNITKTRGTEGSWRKTTQLYYLLSLSCAFDKAKHWCPSVCPSDHLCIYFFNLFTFIVFILFLLQPEATTNCSASRGEGKDTSGVGCIIHITVEWG